MTIAVSTRIRTAMAIASLLALCAAGCSSANPVSSTQPASQQAVSAPPPVVQDCTLLTLSPPAEYVCPDHKVYTSTQLRQLREAYQSSVSPK
jgi:hypothetical protein